MDITLTGIDARNPLGYFAALGCLAVLEKMSPETNPKLSWGKEPLPRPVLHGDFTDREQIIAAVLEDRNFWQKLPVLNFADDVKFSADEQREFLMACRAVNDDGRSAQLASALISEGSFAKTKGGKPTDLHFTAGNQKFLSLARKLQVNISYDDIHEALFGPWEYKKEEHPTFLWDVTDDRVYAYSFSDPSGTKKTTIPGADWLALLGLSTYPVYGKADQAVPPGASGSWKFGKFQWGIWSIPLNSSAVRALINTGFQLPDMSSIHTGVFRVFSAKIRRSDQGGYGSFSPIKICWEAHLTQSESSQS